MQLDEILRTDENFRDGLNALLDTELEPILFNEEDKFNTVSGLFTSANNNQGLMRMLTGNSVNLSAVLHNTRVADSLKKVTQTVFPRKNLETGLKDAPLNSYFSPYIALSTYCKLLPPQLDDKQNLYFNASGTVTIAEFFDTLNALYRGYNSEVDRRTSLDNVSFDYDYFNEGYNRVVTTYANPIFNLYTRSELLRPITRAEVAYILVFGMNLLDTTEHDCFTATNEVGYTFDWIKDTQNIVTSFEDTKELKVVTNESNTVSLNLKDYKGDLTVTEYIAEIVKQDRYIPLPLVVSLIELTNVNIMNTTDEFNPLGELSRGELIYVMFQMYNYILEKESEYV
jgi:hypothetical protein